MESSCSNNPQKNASRVLFFSQVLMDVFGGNVKGTRPQVQIVPPQNPWKIPCNPLFWKYLEIVKPTPVRHHESEILFAYVGMPSCRLNSVLFVQGPKTSDVLSTGILPGSIRCLKNWQNNMFFSWFIGTPNTPTEWTETKRLHADDAPQFCGRWYC